MNISIVIFRIIFTAWVIYNVNIEAGIFTAFSIFLIGILVELMAMRVFKDKL